MVMGSLGVVSMATPSDSSVPVPVVEGALSDKIGIGSAGGMLFGGGLSTGGSCSGVWGARVGLCNDLISAAFTWSRWNC